MKTVIIRPLSIFLLLSICTSLFSQPKLKVLSLEDILETYYLQSVDAQKAGLNYERGIIEWKNFNLAKLPTVNFSLNPISFGQSIVSLQDPSTGNFNYTHSFVNNSSAGLTITQPLNLTGGTFQLTSSLNIMNEFSLTKNTFSSTPLRLSYNQPFIGGHKKYIFERGIMKFTRMNIENTLRSSHYEIQKRCVEMYMTALIADISHTNAKDNYSQANTIVRLSTLRYEQGEMTEQDFLQAQVLHEESAMEVEFSRTNRDKSIRNLLNYIELDHSGHKLQLPNKNIIQNIDIHEALDRVRQNNPFFINAQKRRLEIEQRLYNTKIQNAFNGDINLSYGLNQFGDQFMAAYRNPSGQQSVSIGLRIPIVDWGTRRNSYTIVQMQSKATELDLGKEEEQIYETLLSDVESYNQNRRLLDITERQVALAKRQYELTVRSFELGQNTFFELSSARKQFLQAQKTHLDKIAQIWNQYFAIRAVTISDYNN